VGRVGADLAVVQRMNEITGQLRLSGQAAVNSGVAVIRFDPGSGRERWEVRSVVASTNQAASATSIPKVAVMLGASQFVPVSQAGNRGHSWDGNMVTLACNVNVGPADWLGIVFTSPDPYETTGVYLDMYTDAYPGTLADGTICYAVITGTRYTRRG
jgi:hypothetical protein